MRQLLTAVALSFVVGCVGSEPKPNPETPVTEPCTGTRTDNGDGTTTIACLDGTKELVCTYQDCAGVTSLAPSDLTITHVRLMSVTTLDYVWLAWSDKLQSVNLPALTTVVRLTIVLNPALTTVSLPSLTTFSGSQASSIWRNTALRTLSLPALTSAPSGLYVEENTALTSLSLPALATVPCGLCVYDTGGHGGLAITGNTTLSYLSLPALTMGGFLEIRDNPALVSVNLPSLTTAVGTCGDVCKGYPRGGLFVIDNTALTMVTTPKLTTVAELNITGNTAYPQCQAEAILAHLTSPPDYGATLSGNDMTATCPP